MKRLLIITNTMNQGGAETFIMKIFRKLNKTKYMFDFYIMGDKGYYDKEILALGGKITYGPIKTKGFRAYKYYFKNFLKNNKYEYVYKATANSVGALDLYFVKKSGMAKNIIVRSTNSKSDNILLHMLFRPFANRFSITKIAPSTEAAFFMFGKRKTKAGKVVIFKNGVDTKLFKFDLGKRLQKRISLGIKENAKVFIHVGRFTKQKNHMFVLNIFSKISSTYHDAILLLVGTGELKQNAEEFVAEQRLEDKVLFLENRADINELLMAADVLFLPSLFEGLPNIIIEAQAACLPCIVSTQVSKEVKITNLVTFLDINNVDKWVNLKFEELFINPIERSNYKGFPDEYDSKQTSLDFIKIVFNE